MQPVRNRFVSPVPVAVADLISVYGRILAEESTNYIQSGYYNNKWPLTDGRRDNLLE